jgi:hypothetical protein
MAGTAKALQEEKFGSRVVLTALLAASVAVITLAGIGAHTIGTWLT